MNRAQLTALINTDVRELLSCVNASDSADAINWQASIDARLPFINYVSDEQLRQLVVDGAALDIAIFAVRFYEDLQAAAEEIEAERETARQMAALGAEQLAGYFKAVVRECSE